jgi:hypothetical protein
MLPDICGTGGEGGEVGAADNRLPSVEPADREKTELENDIQDAALLDTHAAP